MSLIADALKKAQSASFGRRYLSSEPSAVLPAAKESRRTSSIWDRVRVSPTLLIGLGSGLFFFVLLFAYFFYGKSAPVRSQAALSSARASKPLTLSPPSSVPARPLPLEKEAPVAQEPRQSGESQQALPTAQPVTGNESKLATAKDGQGRDERKTKSLSPTKNKTEGSQLSVTSDLSEEAGRRFNLAVFYQERKDFLQAKAEYERTLELWPLYVEARNNLGVVYKELGSYEEAITELKKALALNPSYTKAYHNLGAIYQIKGDWKQAIKNYEMALSLERNHLGAYNNLGLIYRSQGQPDDARAILEKALAVDPNFPQTHYNLALVLEEIGETEQARLHYQKFIDLSREANSPLLESVRAHLQELTVKK
jgi:tetratricopeptide (TPR) repeat protein